ncbi:MAG: peptidylprolyl isomerase [Gammaproteobacteria bacterium]|nr:peptidylprolyl isomerase [Gammaproteobacteria bacterium]
MNISNDTVVSIHYTLRNLDGDVLDSSVGQDPLIYLHGAQQIIVGLENALIGKVAGDEFEISINPEQGYGSRDEGRVGDVPLSTFEGVDELQVGMRFQAETPEGPTIVMVTGIGDDTVTVDGNHPLAGQELYFEVSVLDVRAATPEEIDHGHAHGPDAHA